MSWGSEAASSGSGAGASAASSMPSSAGGYSAPATSGFQLDNATAPTQGPTVAAGNMQTYGTENPSMMAVAGNTLERFQKGQGQSMGQTFGKGFVNKPETYGYISAKLQQMSKAGGGGGGSAPITTNISYQQPENGYLASRRRRY